MCLNERRQNMQRRRLLIHKHVCVALLCCARRDYPKKPITLTTTHPAPAPPPRRVREGAPRDLAVDRAYSNWSFCLSFNICVPVLPSRVSLGAQAACHGKRIEARPPLRGGPRKAAVVVARRPEQGSLGSGSCPSSGVRPCH